MAGARRSRSRMRAWKSWSPSSNSRTAATPTRMRCTSWTTSRGSHVGDIELTRSRRRGSRSGTAGFDSHHDKRQGQAGGLCRAVSPGSVRPVGCLGITWHERERWSPWRGQRRCQTSTSHTAGGGVRHSAGIRSATERSERVPVGVGDGGEDSLRASRNESQRLGPFIKPVWCG